MRASKVFDYDANLVVNLSGPSTEAKQQQIFYIKQNGKHVFETQNKRKTVAQRPLIKCRETTLGTLRGHPERSQKMCYSFLFSERDHIVQIAFLPKYICKGLFVCLLREFTCTIWVSLSCINCV